VSVSDGSVSATTPATRAILARTAYGQVSPERLCTRQLSRRSLRAGWRHRRPRTPCPGVSTLSATVNCCLGWRMRSRPTVAGRPACPMTR